MAKQLIWTLLGFLVTFSAGFTVAEVLPLQMYISTIKGKNVRVLKYTPPQGYSSWVEIRLKEEMPERDLQTVAHLLMLYSTDIFMRCERWRGFCHIHMPNEQKATVTAEVK